MGVVVVAILLGVVVSLGIPEWGRGAAAIGMVAIGMDGTGAVAIGMDGTGMDAIGTTGTTIGIIIAIMSSLSATSASRIGGVGVGEAGDGDTHMDITATAIRTAMATVMEVTDTVITDTGTAMDMATVVTADTALPLGLE